MSTNPQDKQERKESDLGNHWHLDKRVPLSIILALFIQILFFTVFMTKLDERVSSLEKDSQEVHSVIKNMAEIRIHQIYMSKDIQSINSFLRNDVEWIDSKKRVR